MYLLFDIGGTKTRIALSRDGQAFGEPVTFPTPQSYDEGIAMFKKTAIELLSGSKAFGAAGGIAGPFSERKALMLNSAHLPDWVGKPIRQELESFLGAPVHIENDSVLVGLGEAIQGGGRGFEIVAYLTVSTGVGGARYVNGTIDAKSVGFEPGYQIIDVDQSLVSGQKLKTLEDIISGKSIEARMGKPAKEITDGAFWDETAKYLAYGLNNMIVHWSPDVVVLGGSMITGNPAIPLDRVEAHLKEILTIYPELPVIRKAELQDVGGLWGALAHIKRMIA